MDFLVWEGEGKWVSQAGLSHKCPFRGQARKHANPFWLPNLVAEAGGHSSSVCSRSRSGKQFEGLTSHLYPDTFKRDIFLTFLAFLICFLFFHLQIKLFFFMLSVANFIAVFNILAAHATH